MAVNVAINGFGRIGRLVFRALVEQGLLGWHDRTEDPDLAQRGAAQADVGFQALREFAVEHQMIGLADRQRMLDLVPLIEHIER